MANPLLALTSFLRDRRSDIVRAIDVQGHVYNPTYGLMTRTECIEVVDFDQLLRAIDEFSEEFK